MDQQVAAKALPEVRGRIERRFTHLHAEVVAADVRSAAAQLQGPVRNGAEIVDLDGVVVWARAVHGSVDCSTLDATERQRVDAAADPRTAARRAAGFALVRDAVGAVLGTDGSDVELDRTCSRCGDPHGPPRIRADRGLHISVTHVGPPTRAGSSGTLAGLVAVALTRLAPVGLDLVDVSSVDFDGFDAVARHPDDGTLPDVVSRAHLWARKEAVLKAIGTGLTVDPSSFAVAAPGVLHGVGPEHQSVRVDDLDVASLGFPEGPGVRRWCPDRMVGAVALVQAR